jgi:hypothetical protein
MRAILLAEGLATQSRDHVVTRTPLREFPEKMPVGPLRLFVNGEVYHWGTNILSFLNQDDEWRVSGIADNGRTGGP